LERTSHYGTQAGLELVIFLPQPLQCRDYRHVSPHLVYKFIKFPVKFL
jgi:hypothetical protein